MSQNANYSRGMDGRTAPRTTAMDTFRWGSGGTSLGEWEHNNYSRGTLANETLKCLIPKIKALQALHDAPPLR